MITGCIYMFTNTINNKVYIGKTINLKSRYSSHINCKPDTYFHRALIKYGENVFRFQILEEKHYDNKQIADQDLFELEIKYIDLFDSSNPSKGYNLTKGGEGPSGITRSIDTRIKISNSKKGDKNPCKNKRVKEKISKTLKKYHKEHPRHHTEETKLKLSQMRMGDKNPMYGKFGEDNPSFGTHWTEHVSEKKYKEFCRKRSELTTGDKNPMYGKSAMKGKHYEKVKWVDENGDIREMSRQHKKRYHKDWKEYYETQLQ